MSKVLVDRELLERCVDRWACCAIVETPGAEQAWLELRAVVKAAQPAEAEGVEIRRVVLDALVSMIAGVTSMIPPTDQPLPDFVQAPVDRAVERITAALAAVTAERDRLQRNLKFTEQWYAERFERLADLGKSAGCWDAMAAIIANGTADPYEPPTYAQQLVRANHRAEVAERERDQLRAEVEALRNEHTARESMARRLLWLAFVWNDHNFEEAHIEARREAEAHGITTLKQANEWLSRIDAAMAAKEA